MAIYTFLGGRDLYQVVDVEHARLIDEALDGDGPRASDEMLCFVGDFLFVRRELVEIVVVSYVTIRSSRLVQDLNRGRSRLNIGDLLARRCFLAVRSESAIDQSGSNGSRGKGRAANKEPSI